MKNLLIILALVFSLSLNANTITREKEPVEIEEISQFYEPGVHYDHKACCIEDRWVNGLWCYAKWFRGVYPNGYFYFYFEWRAY